jgi:hypothetical protein
LAGDVNRVKLIEVAAAMVGRMEVADGEARAEFIERAEIEPHITNGGRRNHRRRRRRERWTRPRHRICCTCADDGGEQRRSGTGPRSGRVVPCRRPRKGIEAGRSALHPDDLGTRVFRRE